MKGVRCECRVQGYLVQGVGLNTPPHVRKAGMFPLSNGNKGKLDTVVLRLELAMLAST